MAETRAREILNVEQAAEYLGFSAYTVREKARTGEIPARKVGREWRFSTEVLRDWMQSGGSSRRSSFTIAVEENFDGTYTARVQDDPQMFEHGDTPDVAVTQLANKLQRASWNPKYRRELPDDSS